MHIRKIIAALFAVLFIIAEAQAQKCVNPNFETYRLDFRDLGYPGATEIPADDTPITALLAHTNGKVYGATSGKRAHLFVNDYRTNKVFPLGMIPETRGVHHALVEGAEGAVYIGTGLNEIELATLSRNIPYGRRTIENQLWADIKARYDGYAGGHIFRYDPAAGDDEVYLPGAAAQIEDLGVAVPGNSVYAMTTDLKREKIYGISYPDAHFFEYDIAARSFRDHGPWMTMLSYPGPERSWRGVPRALACGADGRIYSSGDNGLIHCFDPATLRITATGMRIPGEYWETQNYNGFPVIEQLLPQADSTLLGSTSDGFLFRICPVTEQVTVYGKPRVERRVRAMTLGQDGYAYMICGEKDNVCRLFSLDLTEKRSGFHDYGVLGVDRSPYYAKIGYQFDAMCTAQDGTIFIGESDRRAKLFFYIPGGNIMRGALNPTNPR